MFISDIMSTCVAECTEDLRLEAVYELIQQCDHRLVVVIDSLAHRVPIGVVTERSICEQIIGRGRNPRNLLAGSVMDTRIKKVRENEMVETVHANDADLTAIVVVDDNRRICGLVSREQLKNLSPVAGPSYTAASVPSRPAGPSSRRTSEIPAFGWIQ